MNATNIFPVQSTLVTREERAQLLKQTPRTFWLTGLSGAGKTTVARRVERKLFQQGYLVKVLDGDDVRTGLCAGLSFSAEDRTENIRRIAEASRLLLDAGVITINSFVSPTRAIRELAKDIIGTQQFREVYVNASLELCEARDVKGLYRKARAGEIKSFTGVDAPFEAPDAPSFVVNTTDQTPEQSAQSLYDYILKHIKTP